VRPKHSGDIGKHRCERLFVDAARTNRSSDGFASFCGPLDGMYRAWKTCPSTQTLLTDDDADSWIPLSAHVRDVAENLRPQKPEKDKLVENPPQNHGVAESHATHPDRSRAAFGNRSEWLIAVFLRWNRDV
jgi:hypothetical protein